MPRRLVTREFKPSRPLYVCRPFIANGRHYKPGDAFDWTKKSISARRVSQLFDVRFVDHKPAAAHSPVRPAGSPPPEGAAAPPPEELGSPEGDDLDAVDTMVSLRKIAEAEGAPIRLSKIDQRAAIREHRRNN